MSKLSDRYSGSVEVEEILLDSSNIPEFNRARLEGKRELPITKRNVRSVWIVFAYYLCLHVSNFFASGCTW